MEDQPYIPSPKNVHDQDIQEVEHFENNDRWGQNISDQSTSLAKGDQGDADNFVYEFCTSYEQNLPLYFDENQVSKDENAKTCSLCSSKFQAFFTTRYNCRRCGAAVCKSCSQGRLKLSQKSNKAAVHCFKCEVLVINFEMIEGYNKFHHEKLCDRNRIKKLVDQKSAEIERKKQQIDQARKRDNQEQFDFNWNYEKKEEVIYKRQEILSELKAKYLMQDQQLATLSDTNKSLKYQKELAKERLETLKEKQRTLRLIKSQKDAQLKDLQLEKLVE
ncbi:unnamed protein product [Moneuplotes crassus]|uniref:FYVE-type domain-containing protein n=1 Tax=Euplotes crassus TaxID=5936 RepID=A0AAD2D262_EUPCR|nr:unnamed protein product [Moneuplotes crassus]